VDVSAPWLIHLPGFVRSVLDSKTRASSTRFCRSIESMQGKGTMRFRMRPFGMTSYYDTFQAVQNYNLTEVAG